MIGAFDLDTIFGSDEMALFDQKSRVELICDILRTKPDVLLFPKQIVEVVDYYRMQCEPDDFIDALASRLPLEVIKTLNPMLTPSTVDDILLSQYNFTQNIPELVNHLAKTGKYFEAYSVTREHPNMGMDETIEKCVNHFQTAKEPNYREMKDILPACKDTSLRSKALSIMCERADTSDKFNRTFGCRVDVSELRKIIEEEIQRCRTQIDAIDPLDPAINQSSAMETFNRCLYFVNSSAKFHLPQNDELTQNFKTLQTEASIKFVVYSFLNGVLKIDHSVEDEQASRLLSDLNLVYAMQQITDARLTDSPETKKTCYEKAYVQTKEQPNSTLKRMLLNHIEPKLIDLYITSGKREKAFSLVDNGADIPDEHRFIFKEYELRKGIMSVMQSEEDIYQKLGKLYALFGEYSSTGQACKRLIEILGKTDDVVAK